MYNPDMHRIGNGKVAALQRLCSLCKKKMSLLRCSIRLLTVQQVAVKSKDVAVSTCRTSRKSPSTSRTACVIFTCPTMPNYPNQGWRYQWNKASQRAADRILDFLRKVSCKSRSDLPADRCYWDQSDIDFHVHLCAAIPQGGTLEIGVEVIPPAPAPRKYRTSTLLG
jgi:hypothetical protein